MAVKIKDNNYDSPRISAEVTDCALPLTFDQFSRCSFGCLYCFAAMERAENFACSEAFKTGEVSSVNVDRVKKLFLGEIKKGAGAALYETLIKKRIPLHWGGLSDPADEYERTTGVGLELLRFFREIDYPVFLCFKGNTFHTEPAYDAVFRGATNFAHQFSIVSLDEAKCKKIERGAPSPFERLRCMEISHKEWGLPVYLRLRPYVIGLSDDTADELIQKSAAAGAQAVSVEFFCMNANVGEYMKSRYKIMSETLGYDIEEFYRTNSRGETYRRLSPAVKMPILLHLRDVAHTVGIRFAVSGPIGKQLNDTGCCCGLPDGGVWGNWTDRQFTSALLKCKACGECSFEAISSPGRFGVEHLKLINADTYLNLGGKHNHQMWRESSLWDWLRFAWNKPMRAASPYHYFWGLMTPDRLDEKGNIVYKYNPKAYEGADK